MTSYVAGKQDRITHPRRKGKDAMQNLSPEMTARNWPYTMRISRTERRLLTAAASQQRISRAELVRQVLNPLFAKLAAEVGRSVFD